ncbi:hypothetical protein EG68_00268 [Paragonimus skrjabini miyazakii]|uniref:Uncharacterized protein n=1 Tax=Paragonimus skrjabini miyazakii TaxID=59628 RepID=A0A8S9ZA28_9TREM|nr:hypothetical protein EG68_00268 [Paragonimus skrjabini miyazakii]
MSIGAPRTIQAVDITYAHPALVSYVDSKQPNYLSHKRRFPLGTNRID